LASFPKYAFARHSLLGAERAFSICGLLEEHWYRLIDMARLAIGSARNSVAVTPGN
jgi:hypothetical protein